ncbi:kinetochore Sim4 complex subunit FTA2-domain-containing protein [Xylaria telfairii]|nr:kinetochore Sim4 complex subunit FTA2-domain-containing protein [Xylaria telfairii]
MAPDVDSLLLRRLPVPPCEGPKLRAFKHFRGEIEFLRLLSCDPRSEESETGHSYVFDVRIAKERFALKVFKFYDASEARYEITTSLRRKVSNETLTFHTDPFFAECRAYARINEHYEDMGNNIRRRPRRSRSESRNIEIRPLAVPCFGYITLGAEYEKVLQDKFKVFEWDRLEAEESGQIPRKPFRALVKKLVPSQVSVLNPRRMLGDLKQLRKIGIYTRDIYARNYKAGLLVDFSVAWTEPYWCLVAMGPHARELAKKAELSLFDEMIEREKIKTVVRATRKIRYCQKLRSYDIDDSSEASSVWARRHM